jgi:hypothetical protein
MVKPPLPTSQRSPFAVNVPQKTTVLAFWVISMNPAAAGQHIVAHLAELTLPSAIEFCAMPKKATPGRRRHKSVTAHPRNNGLGLLATQKIRRQPAFRQSPPVQPVSVNVVNTSFFNSNRHDIRGNAKPKIHRPRLP